MSRWYDVLLDDYIVKAAGPSSHMAVPVSNLSDEARALLRATSRTQLATASVAALRVDNDGIAAVVDGSEATHIAWFNVYTRNPNHNKTPQPRNDAALAKFRAAFGPRRVEVKPETLEEVKAVVDTMNDVWPVRA